MFIEEDGGDWVKVKVDLDKVSDEGTVFVVSKNKSDKKKSVHVSELLKMQKEDKKVWDAEAGKPIIDDLKYGREKMMSAKQAKKG